MTLKHTAFHSIHSRLDAKLVPFAGYEMPVQYAGIVEEHRRVRDTVGLFDVSHMGEVEVKGADALDFVQRITVNDASRLTPGKVQYSAMCYDDAGIVDDLLVYRLDDSFLLVINASNIEKDLAWMHSHLSGDVTLTDKSDATSLLAVQGPKSLDTLKRLTDADLSSLEYYTFLHGKIAGVPMIISRTGYTGELGFEMYFSSDPATGTKVWEAVMEAGKEYSLAPAGLGARDTLRLEMGFCLYGNDIDKTTNPLEAGLQWLTKLEKDQFCGRDTLLRAKEKGIKRKLVGFTFEDRAFPRHGYTIHCNGSAVGAVTSGTFSPTLEKGIGMGYVPIEFAQAGSVIHVAIRNKQIPATVVKLPFIKK